MISGLIGWTLKKMVLIWSILWCVTLVTSVEAVEKLHHHNKITVNLSGRKPFVMLNQNAAPMGLDVFIIEHFAQELNLWIDYLAVNISQHNIFTERNNINEFPDQSYIR